MTDENERHPEEVPSTVAEDAPLSSLMPEEHADGKTPSEDSAPVVEETSLTEPDTRDETEDTEDTAPSTESIAIENEMTDSEASDAEDTAADSEELSALPVPTENRKEKEPKPRSVDSRFDLAELFIFSLVAVLLLSAFIFRHTVVDGGSMENTLQDGENLIISDLFYTPKTGDIVVVEDYHTPFRKPLIKRVIATGGQTVMILPTGVYVDGFLLEEDYVHTEPGYRYTPVPEFTVPEGMIYIMGDHRDNSTDSRAFGCVSEEAVLGRVLLRYFPFSRFGTVD